MVGVLALGLFALGLGAFVAPSFSSVSYGVPTDASAWVMATGLRDVALGAMVVGLWWGARDALKWFLPGMMLVPLGDVVIVLLHGESIVGIAPHAAGTVYIALLSWCSWRWSAPRTP